MEEILPPLTRQGPGRPSLYKPEYTTEVLKDMEEGYSLTAFAGKVGVNRMTINEWRKKHPEFEAAVATGMAKRLRLWEKKSMDYAFGDTDKGNSTVLVFGLRNAGAEDWKDESTLRLTGAVGLYDATKFKDLSDEDLQALERIFAKLTRPDVPALGDSSGNRSAEQPED